MSDAADSLLIHAVTGPLGPSTFQFEGRETTRYKLVAWRVIEGDRTALPEAIASGEPIAEPLSIRRLGGVDVRLEIQKAVDQNSVAAFRIGPPKRHEDGTWAAELIEAVGPVDDEALGTVADERAKPVAFTDAALGTFTLNRAIGCFEGPAAWAGFDLTLNIETENADEAAAALREAKPVWDEPEKWKAALGDAAADGLLETFNDNWREEDEGELTRDAFAARLRPIFLTIEPDGGLTFECDDDDLFGGHRVKVAGSVEDGLDEAYL